MPINNVASMLFESAQQQATGESRAEAAVVASGANNVSSLFGNEGDTRGEKAINALG